MGDDPKTGCWICKQLDWIDEDSLSGYPGPNSGFTCNKRDCVEDFKTFPCVRKLSCQESIGDKEIPYE